MSLVTGRFFVVALVGLALIVGALMVGTIALVVKNVSSAGDQIAPEIVRSAIAVILVGIFGSLVTYLIRQHAAEQEEHRRLDEYRIGQLRDIVSVYNQTKAVRRALRAAGFDRPGLHMIEAWQIEEFRRQMEALSGAELALEKTKREMRANLGRLTRDEEIRATFLQVEEYLNSILDEWEDGTVPLVAGPFDVTAAFPELTGFLAGSEEADAATFKRCVSGRMRFAQDCIRSDIARRAKGEFGRLEPEPVAEGPASGPVPARP